MISSPPHDSPFLSCPFLACFVAVCSTILSQTQLISWFIVSEIAHVTGISLINETHSSTAVLISALSLQIFAYSPTRLKDHASHICQNHIFQALKSIYETSLLVFRHRFSPLCPLQQTITHLHLRPVLCRGRRKELLVQTVQCPTFCRSTYFEERYGAPAIAALDGSQQRKTHTNIELVYPFQCYVSHFAVYV